MLIDGQCYWSSAVATGNSRVQLKNLVLFPCYFPFLMFDQANRANDTVALKNNSYCCAKLIFSWKVA
jgi:hypothetical protein